MVGAASGVIALLRPQGQAPARAAATSTAAPVDVAGFAELAVRSWLDADDADGLFAEAGEVAHEVRGDGPVSGFVAAVAARPVGQDYWAITVAAEVADPARGAASSTWFLEVGVARGRDGLVAVASPAVVPAPATADVRVDGPLLRTARPDEPVIAAVEAFLGALLTGTGDVGRYLAPGVTLSAVVPPPFTTVQVQRATATETDARRLRLRADVEATTAAGSTWPLHYEVSLLKRAGRWEVGALSGAPAIAGTTPPPNSSPPTEPPRSPTSSTPIPGA